MRDDRRRCYAQDGEGSKEDEGEVMRLVGGGSCTLAHSDAQFKLVGIMKMLEREDGILIVRMLIDYRDMVCAF